ncbi:hypothetical protein HII31_12900 [Pseudocercospora fuligena]|uniref:Uncharacterized protein n=1 Tax=Pseudocercospora fuligena TaxID=685502 RepID=A0A8H6R772_9PEZI|nr:hypothetical protein HII31_12900 [Pseudocercospora fuligena]
MREKPRRLPNLAVKKAWPPFQPKWTWAEQCYLPKCRNTRRTLIRLLHKYKRDIDKTILDAAKQADAAKKTNEEKKQLACSGLERLSKLLDAADHVLLDATYDILAAARDSDTCHLSQMAKVWATVHEITPVIANMVDIAHGKATTATSGQSPASNSPGDHPLDSRLPGVHAPDDHSRESTDENFRLELAGHNTDTAADDDPLRIEVQTCGSSIEMLDTERSNADQKRRHVNLLGEINAIIHQVSPVIVNMVGVANGQAAAGAPGGDPPDRPPKRPMPADKPDGIDNEKVRENYPGSQICTRCKHRKKPSQFISNKGVKTKACLECRLYESRIKDQKPKTAVRCPDCYHEFVNNEGLWRHIRDLWNAQDKHHDFERLRQQQPKWTFLNRAPVTKPKRAPVTGSGPCPDCNKTPKDMRAHILSAWNTQDKNHDFERWRQQQPKWKFLNEAPVAVQHCPDCNKDFKLLRHHINHVWDLEDKHHDFERWRQQHPSWNFLNRAPAGNPVRLGLQENFDLS